MFHLPGAATIFGFRARSAFEISRARANMKFKVKAMRLEEIQVYVRLKLTCFPMELR